MFGFKKEKIVPYPEIRDDLWTFDVLCCEPHGLFASWIEHTAFVYRSKAVDQVMVYESTNRKYNGKNGVRLVPMAQWLRDYPGKVRLRHTHIVDKNLRRAAEIRAGEHIKEFRGTPYPNLKTRAGKWFLINARLDLPFKNPWTNKDRFDVFFCAMLGAHWFRFCKLTRKGTNPAEADTKDFRKDGKFMNQLRGGVCFGKEFRIK